MVDLISFSSVLRLIGDECKVVLIGDPHQLPPVGPGLILHCLAGTPGIPHVELKVAKRFGNDIAEVANAVRDGLLPGTFNETVQFIQADAYDMEALGSNLYLEKPEDSVVLCATRKIAAGINQIVQASMTKSNKPLSLFNVEFDSWEYTGFYLGDLLICTRNHWDLGVQNGSLGRLIDVFDEPMQLDSDAEGDPLALGWILWDDGEKRPLREDLLDSLELGYALTVHKSQGSQWRRVIVCLSSSMRVDRSMVYTAITRAQSKVVICGEQQQLGEAIKKAKAADRRKVGLPWRMSVEKSIRSMALAKNQFHPNASRD
jgi:exodeoxyribonuclease V alpha subunit